MPEGEEASSGAFWSKLPTWLVLSAPLITLHFWMKTAKEDYKQTVPEDYQNISEPELKQWIIAHIELYKERSEQSETNPVVAVETRIQETINKFESSYALLDYLSVFKFFIPKFDLLPEEDIRAKCIEFLGSARYKEEYEKLEKETIRDSLLRRDEERRAKRHIVLLSSDRLREKTSKALDALAAHNEDYPYLFIRNGKLCRIDFDERGMPILDEVDVDDMRHILERAGDFYRLAKKEVKTKDGGSESDFYETNIDPPIAVVRDLMSMPIMQLPIPPLMGIIECPTIRGDDVLIKDRGYNKDLKLYYAPINGLKVNVPDKVTLNEVVDAYLVLKEVFCDFPFDSPASYQNCIAALITSVIRPMIQGNVPMVILDKPVSGTGASLIAEVMSLITCGMPGMMMTAPKTEEEWQKTLISILNRGKAIAILDNIEGKLRSPSLASVLTSSIWEHRFLGKLSMISLPNTAMWIGTGNNISLAGDMWRRCYWVRMDPKIARPSQRTGFKHKNLKEWVLDNRGHILSAVLTITRGWLQNGVPASDKIPIMGSFEHWREVIGGIMEYCGADLFLSNLEEMYEQADVETPQWEAFLSVWYEIFKGRETLISTINKRIENECNSANPEYADEVKLFDVLPDFLMDAWNKKKFVRVLGNALSARKDRIFPNGIVIRKGEESKHAIRWLIAPAIDMPTSTQSTVESFN